MCEDWQKSIVNLEEQDVIDWPAGPQVLLDSQKPVEWISRISPALRFSIASVMKISRRAAIKYHYQNCGPASW